MHTIKAHGRCAFIEKKRLLVSIEISNRTFSETDFNVYSVVHFCLNILNETRNNSWHFFYSYERIKIRFQVFNQNRNNKRFDLISNGDWSKQLLYVPLKKKQTKTAKLRILCYEHITNKSNKVNKLPISKTWSSFTHTRHFHQRRLNHANHGRVDD